MTDVKLIENNARVGGSVASELAKLQREAHAYSSAYVPSLLTTSSASAQPSPPNESNSSVPSETEILSPPEIVVFGSAAMDLTSCSSEPLSPASTTPGMIFITPGGVGRNIAEAAQNAMEPGAVLLVSAIGENETGTDPVGMMLLNEMSQARMRADGLVRVSGERTSACSLVLEGDNDLVNGVADMGIVETLTTDKVYRVLLVC